MKIDELAWEFTLLMKSMDRLKNTFLNNVMLESYKVAKSIWAHKNNIPMDEIPHIRPEKEDPEKFNNLFWSQLRFHLRNSLWNQDPGDQAKQKIVASFFKYENFWKVFSA